MDGDGAIGFTLNISSFVLWSIPFYFAVTLLRTLINNQAVAKSWTLFHCLKKKLGAVSSPLLFLSPVTLRFPYFSFLPHRFRSG
jgi:hypothetical protein